MLAPISREAKLVYVFLVMHVDRSDPDNRLAWPTQARLAHMLGYRRVESIDRYIRELESIGAVMVERTRNPTQPLRKRNFYTVRLASDPAPSGQILSVWDVRAGLDEPVPDQPRTLLESGSVSVKPSPVDADTAPKRPEPDPAGVGQPDLDGVREPHQGREEVEVVTEEGSDKEEHLPAPKIGAVARSKQSKPAESTWHRARLATPCQFSGCGGVGYYAIPSSNEHPGGLLRRCPNCWTQDPGYAA